MKRLQLPVAVLTILALSACGRGPAGLLGEKDTIEDEVRDEVVATDEQPQEPEAGPPSVGDEVILPNSPSAPAPDVAPAPKPEAPAPAADPVAAFSLNIDAEKDFDTRLGLVKLSWAATGPIEEIYLWSKGFNREAGDAASDDPCGKIGKRQLLVNSKEGSNLGYDLNDGNDALLPYLNSAQLCDESLCEGYTASPGAPVCRIDLDPSVLSGSFYTRTLTKDAVYHLCARTADGTTCVDSGAVAVPQVSVESASAGISSEGKIRFTLDYLFAVRGMNEPHGCAKVDGASTYNDRDRGRGTLVADCPVNGVLFSAQGIGDGNVDTETFDVEAGDPVVTVSSPYGFQGKDGCSGENDCEGTVKIEARASRSLSVTRTATGESLFSGPATAGIEWVHLQRNDDHILPDGKTANGLPKTKTIEQYETSGTQALGAAAGEGEVTFTNVFRTHKHYRWRARVIVDGKKFHSAPTALAYTPAFRVDQMNPVASTDRYYSDEYETYVFNWVSGNKMKITMQHIKDVRGECSSSLGIASFQYGPDESLPAGEGPLPAWDYAESKNWKISPTVIASPTLDWMAANHSIPLTCRFWGVSHDGRSVDGGTFNWSEPPLF